MAYKLPLFFVNEFDNYYDKIVKVDEYGQVLTIKFACRNGVQYLIRVYFAQGLLYIMDVFRFHWKTGFRNRT